MKAVQPENNQLAPQHVTYNHRIMYIAYYRLFNSRLLSGQSPIALIFFEDH